MHAAGRYRSQAMMSLSDLVQEGNLGLIRAAERFDPRRGLRIATYALFWIRQGMSRGLSNQGRTVRIPVHAVEKLIKINRTRRDHEARQGREPTAEELAQQLGLSVTRVQHLSTVGFDPIPLDARGDDNGSLLDVLEDTQAVDPFDRVSNLEHRALLLSQLTDPERRVLQLRFGFEPAGEQTLNEISSELSITLRRVREIEAQALEKLRRSLEP